MCRLEKIPWFLPISYFQWSHSVEKSYKIVSFYKITSEASLKIEFDNNSWNATFLIVFLKQCLSVGYFLWYTRAAQDNGERVENKLAIHLPRYDL